jgi:hypothetical protein
VPLPSNPPFYPAPSRASRPDTRAARGKVHARGGAISGCGAYQPGYPTARAHARALIPPANKLDRAPFVAAEKRCAL